MKLILREESDEPLVDANDALFMTISCHGSDIFGRDPGYVEWTCADSPLGLYMLM